MNLKFIYFIFAMFIIIITKKCKKSANFIIIMIIITTFEKEAFWWVRAHFFKKESYLFKRVIFKNLVNLNVHYYLQCLDLPLYYSDSNEE